MASDILNSWHFMMWVVCIFFVSSSPREYLCLNSWSYESVSYLVLWNDRTKHSGKPHPNFWPLSSSFFLPTWCYITSENPSNSPPLPYCKLSTEMGVACMITRLGWSVVSREQFHNDICTWSCGSWFATHVISCSRFNISICSECMRCKD